MRIFSLILILLLTSCSSFKSPEVFKSFMAGDRQFDNVEYDKIIKVTVASTRAIHQCNTTKPTDLVFWQHVHEINDYSLELDEYEANKKDSQSLLNNIGAIRTMINQFMIRGQFSVNYCKNKLSDIQASSRIISRAIGKNDKYSYCDGGIIERYRLFEKDYNDRTISLEEFKDLVGDIERLSHVDTSTCDTATAAKDMEDLKFIASLIPKIMAL